jgi:hypothetical protein
MGTFLRDLFPKPDPNEDPVVRRIMWFLCGVVVVAVIAVPVIYWAHQAPLHHPAGITLPGSARGP